MKYFIIDILATLHILRRSLNIYCFYNCDESFTILDILHSKIEKKLLYKEKEEKDEVIIKEIKEIGKSVQNLYKFSTENIKIIENSIERVQYLINVILEDN